MVYHFIVLGAGGIASAVGLILAQWSKVPVQIYIGNRTLEKAKKVARWIEEGADGAVVVRTFTLSDGEPTKEMQTIFSQGDVLLDCLPGSLAPKMAGYAKEYGLHYVNLTEYVAETTEIIQLASNAQTGFVLQSGLAPGYIDLLAHHLYQEFCAKHGVEKVERLEFKVGALTDHAVAPHYYGFTWSPVGVATEYLKDAEALREYKKISLPSLSERAKIIIDGIAYEEDLTSGGAADLPDALKGKVRQLDYKTLRHPGHYAWVQQQIDAVGRGKGTIEALQQKMEQQIPHLESDQIVLYAAVTGRDAQGVLRRNERSNTIRPQQIGKHKVRAIQATTAAPMVEAAFMLLESNTKGVVLQSMIKAIPFLNGHFVASVYGKLD